ncbi:MAG: hypothetical protein EOP93_06580, partial [Lysobacteraceae bacterium]
HDHRATPGSAAAPIADRQDPRIEYLTHHWSRLLGVAVLPDDNFFDLGGNSILAVQLADRVKRDTGVRLNLVRLAVQSLAEIAADLPGASMPQRVSPPQEEAPPWEPLWLDTSQGRLFAALHPARGTGAGLGVLIAPPLFHELPRSRRLMAEVAQRLASHGLPCLRFDYLGTGDSSASGDVTGFGSMHEDLDAAASVLRQAAGVGSIAVLTFRGGALPVWSWLASGGKADRVVLWEPILDGAAWMQELERRHVQELASPDRYPLRKGVPAPDAPGQLMGYAVSRRLRDELSAQQVRAQDLPDAWALLHSGQASDGFDTLFELPQDMPSFGDSTRMDRALFVSPSLRPVVDALATALAAIPAGQPA